MKSFRVVTDYLVTGNSAIVGGDNVIRSASFTVRADAEAVAELLNRRYSLPKARFGAQGDLYPVEVRDRLTAQVVALFWGDKARMRAEEHAERLNEAAQ